jgi:hypothetical protein
MAFNKGGNEEVGVIVAFVHAQREWNPGSSAGSFQKLGSELGCQELVCGTLIDE